MLLSKAGEEHPGNAEGIHQKGVYKGSSATAGYQLPDKVQIEFERGSPDYSSGQLAPV